MEKETEIDEFVEINPYKNKVHKILAYSYLFYLVSFLLGLLLDFIFPIKFFGNTTIVFLGVILLISGTVLVIWAQSSSLGLNKGDKNKKTFYDGPYKYTRSPTHFGLFFMMLGFGVINNALFIIIFSIISFIVSKIFFLKKEEEILALKYGAPYLEYKNKVKL